LIRMGAAGARRTGTHVAAGYYGKAAYLPFARGQVQQRICEEANAANTRTHLFRVRTVGGFFFCLHVSQSVKPTLRGNDDEASDRHRCASGNWKACWRVFPVLRIRDLRAWVMFGPCGAVTFPSSCRCPPDLQAGFPWSQCPVAQRLDPCAVNARQTCSSPVDGRRPLPLLGIRSRAISVVDSCCFPNRGPPTPCLLMLGGRCSVLGRRQLCDRACRWRGSSYPAESAGFWSWDSRPPENIGGAVVDGFSCFPHSRATLRPGSTRRAGRCMPLLALTAGGP